MIDVKKSLNDDGDDEKPKESQRNEKETQNNKL